MHGLRTSANARFLSGKFQIEPTLLHTMTCTGAGGERVGPLAVGGKGVVVLAASRLDVVLARRRQRYPGEEEHCVVEDVFPLVLQSEYLGAVFTFQLSIQQSTSCIRGCSSGPL